MIVEVAGKTFKSKKALLDGIRDILYFYPPGKFVSQDDADFLTACLKKANAYYGYPDENPTKWRVQHQSALFGARHPEFVFYRSNGTRENPSIRRLAMTKSKSPKHPKMGARGEVVDQILEYRNSRFSPLYGFRCEDPECGHASFESPDFEVDHVVPFTELWDIFLSNMGATDKEIGIAERRDESGVLIGLGLTYPYDIAFKGFHKQHAKLQLLCRGCHAHKTYAAKQP